MPVWVTGHNYAIVRQLGMLFAGETYLSVSLIRMSLAVTGGTVVYSTSFVRHSTGKAGAQLQWPALDPGNGMDIESNSHKIAAWC